MRRPLLFTLIFSGCAQDIVVGDEDAGRSGADRALDASGNDASSENDAGVREDASVGEDATPGDSQNTDAAGLRWAEMVFAPAPRELQAVWGRSATEVYVASGGAAMYRWDGAEWREFYRDPQNLPLRDIWGTAGVLYLATDRSIVRFEGQTTTSVTYPASRAVHAIWGFGTDDLYAVIAEQLSTGLFRYDGQRFTPVYEPMGVRELYAVWGPSRDEIYFGGSNGALFRLFRGVVEPEQVEYPAGWTTNDVAMMEFRFIRGFGSELIAGGSQHLIFRRSPDGVWRPVYAPNQARDLNAAASFDGTEIFAAGGGASYGPLVRWDGVRWSGLGLTDQWELTDIYAASPDLYFAVGWRRNGVQGVALIGRR